MNTAPYRQNKIIILGISTSEIELSAIAKAWFFISLAFGIVLNNGDLFSSGFILSFLMAALTVGVGFLLHELAHKLVAQHYGCFAEFRSYDQFLFLSVLMSFFGFVFAAPGAVMIFGPIGNKRNGIISAAGPLTNIAIALVFLSISFSLQPSGYLATLLYYGFHINTWLALFNMIPFWNFDGAKIWKWNRGIYALLVIFSAILMFITNFVKP